MSAAASPRRLKAEAGFTQSYLIKSPCQGHSSYADGSREALKARMLEQSTFGFRPGAPHGVADASPAETKRPSASQQTMPELLIFHSWWNEEVATPPEFQRSGDGMGVRKQLRLQHTPSSGMFQLFLDDLKVPLTLAIEHSDGTPLRARELFVGARIDVLGRQFRHNGSPAHYMSYSPLLAECVWCGAGGFSRGIVAARVTSIFRHRKHVWGLRACMQRRIHPCACVESVSFCLFSAECALGIFLIST